MKNQRTKDIKNHYKLKLDLPPDQAEIRRYVTEKPLNRPKINVFKILLYLAYYLVIAFSLSYTITNLFKLYEYKTLVYILTYLFVFYFFAKKAFICLIKIYQRTAPEFLRRACLCKPTCSDYAIAVLNKYNLFVAVFKIIKRLTITCRNSYKIDEP